MSWCTGPRGRSAACGAKPYAAPLTALNTLQSHVSYLRAVLGGKDAILACPPGYVLALGADGTDVQLAERLLRESTSAADPAGSARQLREALALWRGRPLADMAGVAWLEEQAGRLDLLRAQISRALCEARLAAGEHAQLIPELDRLVTEQPLDERVHALLMLALYRSGRQADALAAYQHLRATLSGELGIDPTPALRELEMSILRQDPSLAAPAAAMTLLGRGPRLDSQRFRRDRAGAGHRPVQPKLVADVHQQPGDRRRHVTGRLAEELLHLRLVDWGHLTLPLSWWRVLPPSEASPAQVPGTSVAGTGKGRIRVRYGRLPT
jgi:DNA-binding SARP family transcriptional activator